MGAAATKPPAGPRVTLPAEGVDRDTLRREMDQAAAGTSTG